MSEAQPPADLSDFPSDPCWEWREDGRYWYLPACAPKWVGLSCSTIEHRRELDWWRAYRNAAEAVAEIERRLAEQRKRPKRQRQPTPRPDVAQAVLEL